MRGSGANLSPARIAVIKPCCIGDCVMALPALEALRAGFPDATIDVWVGHHSRTIFEMSPVPSHVIEMPDRIDGSTLPRLALSLRRAAYDILAILDRSRGLRVAARASGAVTESASFRPNERRHESEVYLDVIRALDLPAPPSLPRLSPSEATQSQAQSILRSPDTPFVVLHPGGAQNPGVEMLDKRWPSERWDSVAAQLRGDGFGVLFSGGPGDRAVAIDIARAAGVPESAVLAGDTDIATTTAIISRAALFVGGDTGMSHVAAAVGVPTVAIFGPTNPRRYRPLGPHVRVVAPPESWSLPDVDLRRATSSNAASATASVTVDEVMNVARSLLARERLRR